MLPARSSPPHERPVRCMSLSGSLSPVTPMAYCAREGSVQPQAAHYPTCRSRNEASHRIKLNYNYQY
jgi:hypothetical protein